jgi:hypothetical protein
VCESKQPVSAPQGPGMYCTVPKVRPPSKKTYTHLRTFLFILVDTGCLYYSICCNRDTLLSPSEGSPYAIIDHPSMLPAQRSTHHPTSPACGTFYAAHGTPSQTRQLLFHSQGPQRAQMTWTARNWRTASRRGHLVPLWRVGGA